MKSQKNFCLADKHSIRQAPTYARLMWCLEVTDGSFIIFSFGKKKSGPVVYDILCLLWIDTYFIRDLGSMIEET